MNKYAKKYYRELKLLLPIHTKKEKQLFQNIKLRISELTALNPDVSYQDICSQLGTPLEIISEYYSNCDTAYISKKLRFSQYIRRFIFCLLFALLLLTCLDAYYLHQALEATKAEAAAYSIEYIH